MPKNFSNFASRTSAASLSACYLVGYDPNTNSEIKGTLTDVVSAGTGGGGGTAVIDPPPYNAGSGSGNITLDRANGLFQKLSITNDTILLPPSNGSEGKQLRLWVTPVNTNYNLSIDSSVLVPSDSGLTWPKSLTANKLYVILLQHNGTNWMLISLIGGY